MTYRIVFCGTPQFAVPSLLALKANPKFQVEQVFTQPDRPSGRGKKLQPSAVKKAALELNLSVETPEKVSSPEIVAGLREQNFDLAVVVAYGQLLSQDFLDAFKFGCVNVHSSLLPRWRGAAPMQRALMAGDKETGVSLQKIVKKLDAGDVIAEIRTELPLHVGSTQLFKQLSELGAKLVDNSLEDFILGQITPQPQDESKVTYAKKIEKSEGEINWQDSASSIHNKIRGLDMGGPFAFTHLKGRTLKIQQSYPHQESSEWAPGQVARVEKDSFFVSCGEGVLEIKTLQPENKGRMSAGDYLRGYPLNQGDQFE
jgi:methionyl-tRNA formyltransferase